MNKRSNIIQGFSKLKQEEKISTVAQAFDNPQEVISYLKSFHHPDAAIQDLLQEFSENTISNFPLPYGVAPNFLINGNVYMLPMVIEESSVIAAASYSAKFWLPLGGFKTEVTGTEKVGQVHFVWKDDVNLLRQKFPQLKEQLLRETDGITENMRHRGGGIVDIVLKDLNECEPGLMQLFCTFETMDSMGANFINSCLEQFASTFKNWYATQPEFNGTGLDIIMCILSNLTPNCLVKCWVETDIANFKNIVPGISGECFSQRFRMGVRIAEADPYRAATHNKGIFNGVDAVVLASGNDFRAVEACGHASMVRNGQYSPLSHVVLDGDRFKFTLELPIALGVVGGLTNLHPLVKLSLQLLGNPSAKELMGIAAAAGLASNFSAVKSLVTTGIQEGHMKMHLFNIMKQLEVPEMYKQQVVDHFKHEKVSVSAVRNLVSALDEKNKPLTTHKISI